MPDLRDALASGRPLLLDGAMGTELQRAGLREGECCEEWNLTHPERVCAVHAAYACAGAEALTTHTFQSNPAALARYGLADRLEEINAQALALVRAAAPGRFVLASIGPMDVADTGAVDRVLRSLGEADAYLFETWSAGFEEALARACDPAVNPKRLPVIVSLTYRGGGGRSPTLPPGGMSPGAAARRAAAFSIAALGVNCGRDIGLPELLAVLRAYRQETDLPLLVRPNAGTPTKVDGNWLYPRSAEEMARWLPELLAAGATLIGGCCGTTPEYIRAFRDALR